MDRRLFFIILTALCLVLVLAGCSQVFEAGISGTVVTKNGTSNVGVPNVKVYAYTDSGRRNSDLAKFRSGAIDRPTEGSGYVATTTTNADGGFVVNKIVWETNKSEFGKTADVNKLYMIFYHEDYEVASFDATIISGSTNADNVYIVLNGNKDYTTLQVNVYDIATKRLMGDPCTLRYTVGTSTVKDTVQMTGASTIRISFPSSESGTTVKFYLSSDGTQWKMVNKDGEEKESIPVSGVKGGTMEVNLYMKNYEITLPGFSGDINGVYDTTYDNSDDNLPISLQYYDTDTAGWVSFSEVEDAHLSTHLTTHTVGNVMMYEHGLFEDVGFSQQCPIVINEENYPNIQLVDDEGNDSDWDQLHVAGTKVTVKLRLLFGAKHYDFNYSPLTSPNLRHINPTP